MQDRQMTRLEIDNSDNYQAQPNRFDTPERIETERLVLRIPELSDAADFARQVNDPDIARMTGSLPLPLMELAAEFWVYRARASHGLRRAFPFAIIRKSDGAMMGVMDIFNNAGKLPEIGYWVGKDYWGHGYATEAGRAIIQAIMPALGTDIVTAGIYADNPCSARVLEKIGFTRTGPSPLLFSVARGEAAPGWRYEMRLDKTKSQS